MKLKCMFIHRKLEQEQKLDSQLGKYKPGGGKVKPVGNLGRVTAG
jgi:hypothetical protein